MFFVFSICFLSMFLGICGGSNRPEVIQYRNIGIDLNEWDNIIKEEYFLDTAVGVLKCGIMCSDSKRTDCGGVIYHKNKGIRFSSYNILHYNTFI